MKETNIPGADDDMELEHSYMASAKVNWYHHLGNQFRRWGVA
jgi:hypothetical protein